MRPSPHPIVAAIVAHLAEAETTGTPGQREQPRTHRDSCICEDCYELALLVRDNDLTATGSRP